MNGLMVSLAVLTGLVLTAVGISLFALYRTMAAARDAEQRAETDRQRSVNDIAELQAKVQGLSAQLQDLRREPPVPVVASSKPSLNLSKRSQALRMHRHGDSPEQIAAALEVPPQEVELLVKVHRIVLSSV